MELTGEGLYLKTRAREIIALSERTENDIKNKKLEISGTVFIGATETPAMHDVAKVIKKITDQNPRITFRALVQTEGTNLVFRRLNPKLETGLFLVWRDDLKRTRAAQKFLDEFMI